MGKTQTTFRVKLTETNAYSIDIKARDEDQAVKIAQERYWAFGPLPCAGFDVDTAWRGDGVEFTETEELPAGAPEAPFPVAPVSRSENEYTYSPEHRHGKGWVLANDTPGVSYLTLQCADASNAFANDHEAAFHVICAAAFDVGPEGTDCRNALKEIVCFGQRGLNPIATMLPARQRAKTNAKKA